MKFEFEISDYDFEDFYGSSDFKRLAINEAASQIINKVYDDLDYDVKEIVRNIIKENKQDIINKAISLTEDKLSESMAKKKEIILNTPKISELSKINKENEKYFMELIDKAIAKKFN